MPHTHDVEITDDVVCKTFVSWSQGEPDREWAALTHLEEHAPGLAPRPVARQTRGGRPAIVMSRLPGEPLGGRLSPPQTSALAAALRRLFEVPVPHQVTVRANDPHGFQDRFRAWLTDDHAWGSCQDPSLVRRAVGAARAWLDDHPPADGWLVEPVVALGDGNLDNVLWDGEACRLVDWEEYGRSDLAYELADVVEHASSRLEQRLDAESLLAHFSLDAAQRSRVEHHRRMFACFWLAMLLPGNAGWSRNPRGATESQARWVLHLTGS